MEIEMQPSMPSSETSPKMKTTNSTRPTFLDRELVGRNAIITGSTSGIGLGIARAFAEAGMNVMLNGLGELGEIETIRSEIEHICPRVVATCEDLSQRCGVRALYSPANMTRPDEIAAMVAEAREAFGSVDIVVNNAGVQHVEAIESFPVDKWNAILVINLTSAFHSIRAALPDMKARGYGRIINVASAHALVASPYKSAYVAAKHGLLGLTKTVALETAEHGITANAICPGYVLTPLVEKQIPETAKARGLTAEQVIRDVLLHAQPTRKFVTTDEIGALAVFLCTSLAGSITGTALPIEGGWTSQ
jgi:3-hydroxybutyrate dehydrogenase